MDESLRYSRHGDQEAEHRYDRGSGRRGASSPRRDCDLGADENDSAGLVAGKGSRGAPDYGQDFDAVQQYYQNQQLDGGKSKQQPPASRKGARNQHTLLQMQRAKNIQENSPYAQQFQSIPSQSKQSSSVGFTRDGSDQKSAKQDRRRSSSKSSQLMEEGLAGSGSQGALLKIGYVQAQRASADRQSGSASMHSDSQQQQPTPNVQNWPFYQNGKDARRGGTAPEGATRAHMSTSSNINVSSNPYGMISGQAAALTSGGPSAASSSQAQHVDILKMSTSSNEKARNAQNQAANQSTGAISGGGSHPTPQTSQQNQMIAKIYGRSNKFVINHHGGGNGGFNDQYKKPKIHHMKEIVRQKSSQQKQEVKPARVATQQAPGTPGQQAQPAAEPQAPAATTQPAQGNILKKIKVDNARLKSFQASQAGSQGQKVPQKFVDKKPNNRLQVAGSQKLNKTTMLQGEARNSQSQSRTGQHSRSNVQDVSDAKAPLNQTTPQSDMRTQLEEIKSSMNKTQSQESQARRTGADDIALTKSVDSHRFHGRQSQASRQSRASQQMRQHDGPQNATPQIRDSSALQANAASRNEHWRTHFNSSQVEASAEEANGRGAAASLIQDKQQLARPNGAGEGGRKQKFLPKKANQPVRGVHQARGNAAQKRTRPEQEPSGSNTNQSLALSQRQDEAANERQRLAMLDMGEGGKRMAGAKNETEATPKEGRPMQHSELSRALAAGDNRKDKNSRVSMSQFNRGLEDGSFHLVDEAQFENHKNSHGFTPAGEALLGGTRGTGEGAAGPGRNRLSSGQVDPLAEEGSHVLYADAHNVHFSSALSNAAPDSTQKSQAELPAPPEEKRKPEERSSKRTRQAKNFNKVNDPAASSGLPSAQPAQPTGQEEGDKESDLETLTKLFKPEARGQAEATQDKQQAEFNLAKQQYSEMKRLQTSQGPRTVKYLGQSQKNHQSQPQPAPAEAEQIDENSDEDVKSATYQLEADVESQNTEEGEAFVPPISSRNSRRKKGGSRSGPRDGYRNQLQRPPQTAPSSQMVQIQQQNQNMVAASGSLNRNQKLLKIKGKLSSQYQHTSTIPNPGAQPQDECPDQEGSRSLRAVNESDPNGPSGADDLQKQTSKAGQEQQSFQNDQDNSHARVSSQTNSQQQFSRTIDPTSGNSGIGIMSGNGNTVGAPPAEDKKASGHANAGSGTEPTSKAEEPTSAEPAALPANGSRNHPPAKTAQPAPSKRRDYIGTDHDQGKVSDVSALILSKPQSTQPVSPQTNLRVQNSNPNQAFSLTNMHSGLHPQPGQPLPLQQLGSDSGPSGPLNGVAPGPAANVLGYQYEQWQRPPSRQKEPNQALGLDDARPKTRGGNQSGSFGQTTMLGHQFYGNSHYSHSHVSGRGEGGAPRERKRNIQQFIPHSNSGQGTALYQLTDGPGPQGPGGRNQLSLKQNQAGPAGATGSAANRARMIDFFHQRNNNFNGFNSQDEQVRQNSFQKQYQLQQKPEQCSVEEQRSEMQGLNSGSSMPGGSGPMQKLNPRRNAGQRGFSGPIQAGSMQQRPPSRHKDPPQNLGLDLCPPGMGFASPDEFDPPIAGLTPHHYGAQKGSINGFQSFLGFDLDQDLDGQAFESDLGADDHIDTAGHFLGPVKSGVAPPKQFKEDEDDFFEQQYMKKGILADVNRDKADPEQPKKPEKLKIRTNKRGKFARQQSDGVTNAASNQQYQTGHHQRNLAGNYGGSAGYQANTSHNSLNHGMTFPHQNYSHTYGHGMNMGPLLPGTAPSPGQGGKLFPYHPALQQTQNFYIGMNQILPQNATDAAQAAIVQDFFNMSANVQNMLKNPSKTSHQAKRLISTSQGPGMGHSSQTVTAFHSTGYHHRADMRQAAESTQKGVGNFNHPLFIEQYNQESLARGFANQRSPVNERSGAIHQLLMQNANLKQMNKPKSATGHRISGKQNRFKNLNNSGRFVGQNSTIIHSAYHNQPPGVAGPHGSNPLMPQQIKMFQHPKSGGWMEASAGPGQVSGSKPGHLIGHSQDGAQSGPNTELPGAQMFAKSQLPIGMIKPTQSTPGGAAKGNERRARAQFFPRGDSMAESNKLHNTSGFMAQGSQLQPEHSHTDSAQERIKTGQEPNNNRPKESQGHRSTGKRQNNQSLGVTSISLAPSANAHPMPIPPAHIKRIQMPKTGNFVSSPIAGGAGPRDGPQSFIGGYQVTSLGGTQNLKKGKQNVAELFSQTSKISRGGKRGTTGEGLQQSSMQATDKHLDLSDDPHVQGMTQMHNTTNLPFTTNNQNSFKSQTLQFPNSSQLGADFINLFAD